MQSVVSRIMTMGGHVVFMIGLFSKKKIKKSSDERQVFTLQVDKRCCLSNATMVLLSIQR
jgi:hypothetical protein